MPVGRIPLPEAPGYASRCARIHSAAFSGSGSRAWSPEEFEALLARSGSHLFWSGYGFLLAECAFENAEILTLAVDPSHQARGCGAALLKESIEAFQKCGVGKYLLEVAADNYCAIRLYDRFGFDPIGTRRRYFLRHDTRIDAIVMARCLKPGSDSDQFG